MPTNRRQREQQEMLAALQLTAINDADAAYHEAGHTVVAYDFGWYLRHGGVRIGQRARTCLRAPRELRTTQAEIIVAMAGWIAEAKYSNLSSLVAYDEILDAVTRHRGWLSRDRSVSSWGSDPLTVAGEILKAYPNIDRPTARALVRSFEIETTELMNEPRIWAATERVAAALLHRLQLSHSAAVHLLGRSFFTEVTAVRLLGPRATDDDRFAGTKARGEAESE